MKPEKKPKKDKMAAVQITSAGGGETYPINSGKRNVVRTSAGVLYAVVSYGKTTVTTASDVRVYKSSDGSSWAEQDASNNPTVGGASTYASASCCIDSSGIIHISYRHAITGIRYVTFNTSTDVFSGDTQIVSSSAPQVSTAITVDSSNVPHTVYVEALTSMGSTFDTVTYINKVGGTWNAKVAIEGLTASKDCRFPSITIDSNNVPVVVYYNHTDTDIGTALGNLNNATSFTLFDIEASSQANTFPFIAVDTSGNHHAAYVNSTNDLLVRKHNVGDAWTTWQTAETIDNSNNLLTPSIAINGTARYIFAEDSDDNDIVYYTDSSGSWSGQNSLDVGTYQDSHVKWSFLNNNGGSTQLDYVFSDGTNVFWNKVVLTVPSTFLSRLLLMGVG